MSNATNRQTTITARELADRLVAGDDLTVLDVRAESVGGIEDPSAEVMHVPAQRAIAAAPQIAGAIDGPMAVVCARGQTAQPVAEALRQSGADAAVLEGGLQSWIGVLQARELDLDIDGLKARQIQRPGRGCLSYVFASEGEALVIDPTADPDFYVEVAANLDARITQVVDTHLHADHISVARDLARATGATLRIPQGTVDRGITFADEVSPIRNGDRLEIGRIPATVISLPGHTTDMTGLIVGERALVTGDSLFAEGLARPDLEQGDPEGAREMARTLHHTLRERILQLDPATRVLPGHTHPGLQKAALAPTIEEVKARVSELEIEDPNAFAEHVVADLPPRPANYASVIDVNAGKRPPDPELEQGGNSCATTGPTTRSAA